MAPTRPSPKGNCVGLQCSTALASAADRNTDMPPPLPLQAELTAVLPGSPTPGEVAALLCMLLTVQPVPVRDALALQLECWHCGCCQHTLIHLQRQAATHAFNHQQCATKARKHLLQRFTECQRPWIACMTRQKGTAEHQIGMRECDVLGARVLHGTVMQKHNPPTCCAPEHALQLIRV